METVGNSSDSLQLIAAPSKSQQIARYLEERIRSGAMAPGGRLQSIRNLAQQFGVSSKAVFSACELLEQQGLVVREAGRGVFVADQPAIDSAQFALLTSFREHDIEGYFDDLYETLRLRHGLCTPIMYGQKLPWERMLTAFRRQSPAGILVDVGCWADLEQIREAAGDTPVCFVHRWQWEQPPVAPAVLVDIAGMYEQALRFLGERGHRRIAYVGPHDAPRPDYAPAIRQGAAAAGLAFNTDELPYLGRDDFQTQPERIARIFDAPNRPTALIGVNDHNVAVFRDQLERAHPVCKGIEVVGAYDTGWSKQPGRAFHSFRIDYAKLWRLAFEQMSDTRPGKQSVTYIDAELMVRQADLA